MDILVGRGGNQGMIIDDESVSKIHCKIEVLDSGRMALTNLAQWHQAYQTNTCQA